MKKKLHLFEKFGIELEYMIVNKLDLKINPIADEIIKYNRNKFYNEFDNGKIIWSNELVKHLIELKTNGPVKNLKQSISDFYSNIRLINHFLSKKNCMLMSGAMHPLMNPSKETKIWNHKYKNIYEQYHKIFNCNNHGWANVQSVHLNLPFANENEFKKLMAAIRPILPIIPLISSSSPIINNRITPYLCNRLKMYKNNQKKFKTISGKIIPEKVYSFEEYKKNILQKMYDEIKPFDKKNVLQYEWLNSRGAILRLDRYSIEIRLMDIQENPRADIAILMFIIELIKNVIEEKFCDLKFVRNISTNILYKLFNQSIKNKEEFFINDQKYLRIFGIEKNSISLTNFFNIILKRFMDTSADEDFKSYYEIILKHGNLAQRILSQKFHKKKSLLEIYRRLSDCLNNDYYFF